MSTIVESVKSIRAKLSKVTSGVADDIQKLRATIKAKRDELLRLRGAPLPLAEAERRIAAHVRVYGDIWLRDWGGSLVHGDRALVAHDPQWDPAVPARYLPNVPWLYSQAPPWGAICAADPEGAAALLTGLLRRLKDAGVYVEGPPAAERPALVARLEAELAELEAAEEAIVDQAAEAGLVIQHRPEVVERRNSEASRRQNQEAALADRRTREHALDERHAQAGRSTYLSQDPRPPAVPVEGAGEVSGHLGPVPGRRR